MIKTPQTSTETYNRRYGEDGYGLKYPEGHIIRFEEHYWNQLWNRKPGVMLDFGCGTGAHVEFFQQKGWKAYGCDSSYEGFIRAISKGLSVYNTEPRPNLSDFFNPETFDLILVNQVFSMMPFDDAEFILRQLSGLLKPDGVIVVSWMDWNDWMINNSKTIHGTRNRIASISHHKRFEKLTHSFTVVPLSLFRLNEIMKTHGFKAHHIGFYSHELIQDETTKWWLYIGAKLNP